jgi:hypothetical protein
MEQAGEGGESLEQTCDRPRHPERGWQLISNCMIENTCVPAPAPPVPDGFIGIPGASSTTKWISDAAGLAQPADDHGAAPASRLILEQQSADCKFLKTASEC